MKARSHSFRWLIVIALLNNCQDDREGLPAITVAEVVQLRQAVDTGFEFVISIPKPSSLDVSVDFTTKDGTAVAGNDYFPTSGTATISAGSLTATIVVAVMANNLRRDFQTFYLQLSNPKNCTIANEEPMAKIDNSEGLYLPIDNTGYSTPDSYPGYGLMWSDEFNGNSINSSNWAFDIGDDGWGTHELVYYSSQARNAFVSSGNLIIEARKEDVHNSDFSSARLTTRGKVSFKYGRIDIRARVPGGQGIMPSLWMLGSNVSSVGRPACGEIDIMQLPHTEYAVYNTLHWSDAGIPQQFGLNRRITDASDKFHVYSVIWAADHIQMLVDDVPSFYMDTDSSLPFDNDFFFIFNVAVGGDWPGSPDVTTQFPQQMVVDYVRVFQ